jgi:hypothetical protein
MKSYFKVHPWKVIEEGFDPQYNEVAESVFAIGNGMMGQRANLEETYTGHTLQGTYVGGVYYPDKTRVGWWKNGYPEYFAKVINSTYWSGIVLKINNEEVKTICEVQDRVVVFSEETNKKINERINTFVKKLDQKNQSLDFYRRKRKASIRKAYDDNLLSKKAEFFAAWYFYKNLNFPIVSPDLEIREGSSKGWKPDLPYSKKDPSLPNVHVKSCRYWMLDFCGDYSWTIQYHDDTGYGKDHLFYGPNTDLVACVLLNNYMSPNGIIKAIVPWGIVKQHLDLPVKKSFQNDKRCIYYKNLLNTVRNK